MCRWARKSVRNLDSMKEWPTIPGSYDLGNMNSPIAVVILGRGVLPLPADRYAIKGQLVTENVGLEKVVANIVANPRIRFLLVCGKEEVGHMPGEAIFALWKNGVDKRMRIRGCKSAVPFLCNLSLEAIGRFQEQVKVIDHVDSTDMREAPTEQLARYDFEAGMLDQIHRSITDCLSEDPGPFPAPPCIENNEALRLEGENAARMNYTSADVFTQKMLRLPSEKLSTATRLVTVSEEFGVVVEPVDGLVMRVVSPEFAARLNAYLRGLD